MARTPDLLQMKQLVELRRGERQIAENEVFEAQRGRRRAEEILLLAENQRNDALLKWRACRQSDHIDLGLEPNLACQLILQEQSVEQSWDVLRLAKERLKIKQSHWRQSDLSVRCVEQDRKKAEQRVRSKRDEKQLLESTDRHNFRRQRHGG